ncbi:MAG: tetratricopeptide repeat protein [Parvibaculum sp.]|uniref:tetratricopeptide repeat protein n=1 Tax=Parvibaculum sp. TaxID=2024848 RepID=UPI00271C8CFB|nr:tetratricopeptide repeat protein [Parvibaculum sp.]MDO8838713.1 tetratricopeptide repeat protein [Parvibaculum sp.]
MAVTAIAPNGETILPSALKRVALIAALALLGGCASLGSFANTGAKRGETPYGAYLAGRYAASVNDPRKAAEYYDAALRGEPNDALVLDRAFMAALSAGDVDRAVRLAERLTAIEPGQRMARLTLALADMKSGDFAGAREEIAASAPGPFTALVGTLTSAWAATGERNKELMLEKIGAFEGRTAFALFRSYHQGLMLDLLGDTAGADAAFAEAMSASGGSSVRVVEAYATFLQREGRTDEARAALEGFLAFAPDHPLVRDHLARLSRGEALPVHVRNAADGAAEALYGLGSALMQDTSSDLSDVYLYLALYLRPDFDIARSLLAGTYENRKRWQDAIDAYSKIDRKSSLYMNARIQTAMALNRLEREAEAITVLKRLAREKPDSIDPVVAIGDIYRAKENYAEAVVFYERAIALSGAPSERDWTLYYARGICFERLGEWEKAEKDLKLALKLSDDHPLVLNYLGYSWIEQHHRLDEALAMIEKAVERRPNDGFIVDSLGWARYRLGEYDLAVKYLERAVELQPDDPTINEHLGDAFWKVGRKIEARFQWNHALAMNPEEKRIKLLRTKLDLGLEAAESAEREESSAGAAGS